MTATATQETKQRSVRVQKASRRRPVTTSDSYVGIDIDVDRARVAQLGQCKDGHLHWQMYQEVPLPLRIGQDPPSDWLDRVVQRLEQGLPRIVDGHVCEVTVSLPLPWTHFENVRTDQFGGCQSQCDSMFGNSIFKSTASLTHWPLSPSHTRWMVAATASRAAIDVADCIESLGYHVRRIMPAGPALLSACPALTTITPRCIALLQCTGGLTVIGQIDDDNQCSVDCGICRPLPPLPESLLRKGSPPTLPELIGWLDDVADQIQATMRYVTPRFAASEGGDSEPPVLIAGDLVSTFGIDSALATRLQTPVASWRYAGEHRPNACDRKHDGEIAMALSLAFAACSSTDQKGRR